MPTHFELPRLRSLARHAIPHLIEATLIPLALFYGFLWIVGVWGALFAALGWSYAAILRRVVLRQSIPGLLVLGALGLTARTAVAFASGSVFIYFLQPTLTTVVIAGAFLLSVPAGRPLAERLAADFFPLPSTVLARPAIQRVFVRITLLWAVVNLVNAGVTMWLLLSQPVPTFVAFKTVTSLTVTAAGIGLSTWWFKRTLALHPAPVAAS